MTPKKPKKVKKVKEYKYKKVALPPDSKMTASVQKVLGTTGFILSSDSKYHKDYLTKNNHIIRLVPEFDKDLKLTGITVTTVPKTINFLDGESIPLEQFPSECLSDVSALATQLAPEARIAPKETYVINMKCEVCGKTSSSYLDIDSLVTCLSCASK